MISKIHYRILMIIIISLFLLRCQDSTNKKYENKVIDTYQNMSSRAEPLSISDISGKYRGSYTDKDYGFRLAIKLTINKDETYKRVLFSEGDPIDSASGKAETFVEKKEETDNYGENKVTTYLHGIKLHLGSEWDFKTEIYQISSNTSLIPVRSFADGDNDIILIKENY